MRISRITTYSTRNDIQNTKPSPKSENTVTNTISYNPVAYRDFNINFSGRLWRTPENFFSCKFNQDNMPLTMKEYLEADYEDRQKMPPAQMLALVFEDVKNAKSLEEVKQLYPEEPLFANLSDTPDRKAKTGTLAYIDLFKEDGKSLFKNGKDNLGLYLLQKIYTEGKTLKEINTDFKKDISVHYAGIEELDYKDLHAFGIRFPNNSFWKSLTATREEFPYKYNPRTAITHRTASNTGRTTTQQQNPHSVKQREKGKFADIKDWEIDKLTDAMIKGNGSKTETEKQLKKRNVQNKDAQSFVSKYLGEINSVVMEKLHISPDMKDFFENYDGLSKNQKEKFEEYMKNPYINELRSKVMSSTIRFFFDVYGVDGNNEEFQELLDYAHNIKPNRLAREAEHNRLQEEYERELGIFDEPEKAEEAINSIPDANDFDKDEKLLDYQKLLDEAKKGYDVGSYEFDTDQGKVVILSNLQEAFQQNLQNETKIMPKGFGNKFIDFMRQNPEVDEPYILTTLLNAQGINLPKDDRLISQDEAETKTVQFYQDFTDKFPIESRAAQQAVTDAFIELTKDEITPALFRLGIFEFNPLMQTLPDKSKDFITNKASLINERYNEYKRPLSAAEINKVAIEILELLKKYDPKKTIIKSPTPFEGFQHLFYAIKLALDNDKNQKSSFKKDLSNYLKEYGGAARFLLDKNIPEMLRTAKMEQLLCSYAMDKPGILFTFASLNINSMLYLKHYNYEMYKFLTKNVLPTLPFLPNKKV